MSVHNVQYKDEIIFCIKKLNETNNSISWDDFVLQMADVIEGDYNDIDEIEKFQDSWKRRFKSSCAELGFTPVASNKNAWKSISDRLLLRKNPPQSSSSGSIITPSSSKSSSNKSRSTNSSSSLNKSHEISAEEKKRIILMYTSLDDSKKWVLSSKKVVEDQMKKLAVSCLYRHPCHMMILDPYDSHWEDYFDEKELKELKSYKRKPLPVMPDNLKSYIDSYKNKISPLEIYKHTFSEVIDPYNEKDKKWVRDNMYNIAELYMNNFFLRENISESDLLRYVWYNAIDKLFLGTEIFATSGEKSSKAVASSKNNSRRIAGVEKLERQKMGSKLDSKFIWNNLEVGVLEAGKTSGSKNNTKYLSDGYVKTPTTLMNMLSELLKKNPSKKNDITTTAIVVMGPEIELMIMDTPHNHIYRMSRTKAIQYPTNMMSFKNGMKPLLDIVWKARATMYQSIEVISSNESEEVHFLDEIEAIMPNCDVFSGVKRKLDSRNEEEDDD